MPWLIPTWRCTAGRSATLGQPVEKLSCHAHAVREIRAARPTALAAWALTGIVAGVGPGIFSRARDGGMDAAAASRDRSGLGLAMVLSNGPMTALGVADPVLVNAGPDQRRRPAYGLGGGDCGGAPPPGGLTGLPATPDRSPRSPHRATLPILRSPRAATKVPCPPAGRSEPSRNGPTSRCRAETI